MNRRTTESRDGDVKIGVYTARANEQWNEQTAKANRTH